MDLDFIFHDHLIQIRLVGAGDRWAWSYRLDGRATGTIGGPPRSAMRNAAHEACMHARQAVLALSA